MSRPTPLQNRVAPDGSLHAVAERGLLMGNRGGRFHRSDAILGRARWRSRAWICCLTRFRDRHRAVMRAGYTELFFLDEATALAAGHRPCFECRRSAARAFAAAWGRARSEPPPSAGAMDRILHAERLAARAAADPATLPAGSIFAAGSDSFLWTGRGALRWTFGGYHPAPGCSLHGRVRVLTPPSTCKALAAGYRPHIHPSAEAQFSAR